jgi:cytochrome c oxidase subunit IV
MTAAAANGRVYWVTWGVLLAVTLMMLWLDAAEIPRAVLMAVLLAAMFVKATLITGNFMHLRHEHRGLILTVVLGLAMGFVLYALIAPDALRIREMVTGP